MNIIRVACILYLTVLCAGTCIARSFWRNGRYRRRNDVSSAAKRIRAERRYRILHRVLNQLSPKELWFITKRRARPGVSEANRSRVRIDDNLPRDVKQPEIGEYGNFKSFIFCDNYRCYLAFFQIPPAYNKQKILAH